MKAMILAAGRGERMRPLTDRVPKCLVEVRGRSLLEHHLARLRDAGIVDVVINLGWHGEQVVERIGDGSTWNLRVEYSDERGDVLETGGGIQKALPLLGDAPFLVVNADIYTDMPVPRPQLGPAQLAHLVLVPTPDYREHGDFDLVDGLVRVGDRPALTFSGVAVYRPEFFADCEPGRFPLAPLLRRFAEASRLSGSVYSGDWTDVGTPERLSMLASANPR